jgi:pimeloyl-ACP methyl ester carboxylesterase
MGDTISTLVFRPPRPTPIKLNKFFYIRIPNVEQKKEFNCSSTSCGGMAPPEMDIFPEKGRLNLNRGQNGNGNGANRMKDDMSIMSSLSGSNSNEEYKIPAFFLRRKGAKATILFSHGNAEDLGMMYRRMKEMAMLLCANVLAYDYTGYGLSTPSNIPPSEEMCYRNIEAAYNHLTKTMRIPPSEIILYGRSLGSGPSCYLAKKTADDGESVAGLILHSPFLSIYRIVIDCRVNLVGDMFINRSKAKDIRYVCI